jgi:hypothetical protein
LEDFKSSSKESCGRGGSVSKMLLEVTAIEDLHAGASVSLLFNDSNQIYCRKSFPTELSDAVAARVILKGDSITFDTGRNTTDLLRPSTASYVGGR